MKTFIKLAMASILGLLSLSSIAYAKHHEGKKHSKKHHAHAKKEHVAEKHGGGIEKSKKLDTASPSMAQ